MATPITAREIAGDLREHVRLKEYDGWMSHNRGTHGSGWGPVHGVMLHHFGGYSSTAGAVAYARKGSAELPGPLYNLLIDRGGVVHALGWGRANHAGAGDPRVLDAVISETYPLPRPRLITSMRDQPAVDGNARFYGFCLLNKGDGQEYTAKQLDAAATVCALVCRRHRAGLWTSGSVIGHKEWTRAKPDPSYSMKAMRRRVFLAMQAGIPDVRGRELVAAGADDG